MGDRELLKEVLEIFLEDSEPTCEEIARAVEAADREALEASAHALKGACANVSAERARAAAAELEEMARGGDLGEVRRALARLEARMAELRPVLEGFVRSPTHAQESDHEGARGR